MRFRALLVGIVVAIPVVGAAGPAQACAEGPVCVLVNRVCEKVVGPCIP